MIGWEDEGHRFVGKCGEATVGFVFPVGTKYVRWRAVVTKNAFAVDGSETDVPGAKLAVELRFAEFCALAKLRPIPEEPT